MDRGTPVSKGLLVLIDSGTDSTVSRIYKMLGADLALLRSEVEKMLERGDSTAPPGHEPRLALQTMKALDPVSYTHLTLPTILRV